VRRKFKVHWDKQSHERRQLLDTIVSGKTLGQVCMARDLGMQLSHSSGNLFDLSFQSGGHHRRSITTQHGLRTASPSSAFFYRRPANPAMQLAAERHSGTIQQKS